MLLASGEHKVPSYRVSSRKLGLKDGSLGPTLVGGILGSNSLKKFQKGL